MVEQCGSLDGRVDLKNTSVDASLRDGAITVTTEVATAGSLAISELLPDRESSTTPCRKVDKTYRMSVLRTLMHKLLSGLPPAWREPFAERFLRRGAAPGPALEHVVQYLLSTGRQARKEHARAEATVARGADNFYARQYRQYLNARMGAFAATATQVVLASGKPSVGSGWQRHRPTVAAVVEQVAGAPPLIIVDEQTVAVAVYLPCLRRSDEVDAAAGWLSGRGPMPPYYERLMQGRSVSASEAGMVARERSVIGSVIEAVDTVMRSKRVALLGLHPCDPDAMGLHITLFDVQAVTAATLERDHGLRSEVLQKYGHAARQGQRDLYFLVGATEETFTQCSQNLFVKRPLPGTAAVSRSGVDRWRPHQPLGRLLSSQFELIQATVSAGGLPGVSPRNGDLGKAGFVGRYQGRAHLLIPYFPGNAIHGHAAKLESNRYATVMVGDDHQALTRVFLSGVCRTVDHGFVKRHFPEMAAVLAVQTGTHGHRLAEPQYWFCQQVQEVIQESEALAAYHLDPGRPTCSISAGGQARHNKKPAYFAAETLPPYDMRLQHQREKIGRMPDSSGDRHRLWTEEVASALRERQQALKRLAADPVPAEGARSLSPSLEDEFMSVCTDITCNELTELN